MYQSFVQYTDADVVPWFSLENILDFNGFIFFDMKHLQL